MDGLPGRVGGAAVLGERDGVGGDAPLRENDPFGSAVVRIWLAHEVSEAFELAEQIRR